MPTAIPAASLRSRARPVDAGRRRVSLAGRKLCLALALPIAWALVVSQPLDVSANTTQTCSKWSSLTKPPPSIRVLRRKSGRVETVDFKKYVVTVMGREWPSYLPQSVVEAGAVAVKQYAWYHTLYTVRATANGRCYDVRDGTRDQIYKPALARVTSDHYDAVAATWGFSIRKNDRFIMTGYRRGDNVGCGRDATGFKLFARSATNCARKGYGWREILRIYYGPGLALVSDSASASATTPQAEPAASPMDPPEALYAEAISGAMTGGLGLAIEERNEQPILMRLAETPVA